MCKDEERLSVPRPDGLQKATEHAPGERLKWLQTHTQKHTAIKVCGLFKMATNQFDETKSIAMLLYCSTFPFVILGIREELHYLKREKQSQIPGLAR